MTLSIGQYLLDKLHSIGVRHIYGLPGDYVLKFNKLIEEHPIKFINCTIENSAGYMADAEARLLGLGVACITYGVGIGIANSIAQAFVESSPVIIISGAAGTDEFSKCHYLHHLINKTQQDQADITQLEIFKQITGAQAVLNDPTTAENEINRVIHYCLENKKPVYIEIPRNFIHMPLDTCKKIEFVKKESENSSLKEALDEVVSILQKSRQPVIWAGHEILRHRLSSDLLKFAEEYNIPIASSLLGKTAISEHHPLFLGLYQGGMSRPEVQQFFEKCDCHIILGTVLSDVETGIFSAKIKENIIFANTLEGIRIHHHTYPNILFQDFIKDLKTIKLQKKFSNQFHSHSSRKLPFISRNAKITVTRLFECLQYYLKKDNIVVTDIGDALFGSEDLILDENSFLASAYFETLGFGAPGAIAAQLAMPGKRVIGIVGDGGFQMTAMELATAVRYKLDPVIIVLNNHGYGTERPLLEGSYNDIQDWNYTKIPEVVGGGVGIEVRTEMEFEKVLQEALSTRGHFFLIEAELDKLDFSPTMKRFSALVHKNAKK